MGIFDSFSGNLTDIALNKLKKHLESNEENVIGYFVTYDKTTDELNIKKVYKGGVFLTADDVQKMKENFLTKKA